MHAQTVSGLLADVETCLTPGVPAQGPPLLGVIIRIPVLLEAVSRLLGAEQLPGLVVRHDGGVGLGALVTVAVAVGHVAGFARRLLQGLEGVDVVAFVDLGHVTALASLA